MKRGGEYDASSVADLLTRGRAAWPLVSVGEEELAEHLAAVLGDARVELERVHADIVLACGCLVGGSNARLALEASVLADVPKAVRRVSSEESFVADVVADLRLHLLTSDRGKPALLHRYRGRGPLRSFVMVLAMRSALDKTRRQKEVAAEASVFEALPSQESVWNEPADIQGEFVTILRGKLRDLPPRARAVLRLHVVDGLPVEVIARMYNVHRATMARWVTAVKHEVYEQTQAELRARHNWSAATFQSFAREAATHIDATLSSFLVDKLE